MTVKTFKGQKYDSENFPNRTIVVLSIVDNVQQSRGNILDYVQQSGVISNKSSNPVCHLHPSPSIPFFVLSWFSNPIFGLLVKMPTGAQIHSSVQQLISPRGKK